MTVNLSNLTISRVSAGSSGAVPPSGDPYWSSVVLLTETTGTNTQNNRVFKDSSVNNYTITNSGSVSLTLVTQGTFSPVAGGHSGSFLGVNGSGLDMQNFSYASGDFTIEAWVRPTQLLAFTVYTIFSQASGTGFDTGSFTLENSGKVTYNYKTTSNNPVKIQTTSLISTDIWTHIAVSKSGTSIKIFINGVADYTGTVPASLYQGTSASAIGTRPQSSVNPFYGDLSDVRVTTTAVYTSNFSVPTAPLTAITGTKLLLNFDNAGIYDAATENNMFTAGNAQVSTTVKKFGTTSIKFDGNGDYLYAQPNAALQIMGGDCTIETWFYPTAFPPTAYGGPIVGKTNASNGWLLRYSSSGALQWVHPGLNGWDFGPASLPLNTWYHVAIVKSGSTITGYVNGVQYPITSSTPSETTEPLWIATGNNIGYFTGYIQDMRITKGVARYTANFTPPTAAFPTN